MHYLWFDCETGGTDEKAHSLLTAYFAILDENFNMLDELDLKLKPSSGVIVNDPEAAKITGIDTAEHLADPETITYEQGKDKLLKMLDKHKIKGKRKHYRPSGQNIGFDINFVLAQMVDKEDWSKLVHHRPIDTLSIITVLQDVGILPKDLGPLGGLVEYFNIPMGNAHNAKEDIRMTVDVYKALIALLQSLKGNALQGNTSNNSLLEIIEI